MVADERYSTAGGFSRRELIKSGALLALLPVAGSGRALAGGDSLTAISDRYVERFAAVDPISAGRLLGVGRGGPAVTDWSVSGAERKTRLMRETLARLDRTPPASRSEELAAGFLRDNCEAVLRDHEAGEYLRRMSTSLFTGPPAMLLSSFELMQRQVPGDAAGAADAVQGDWERVAARMERVPGAMESYTASLQAGLDAGMVASRRMTLAVALQCARWSAGEWFQRHVSAYGEGALRPRLDAAAWRADAAYARLAGWLRERYAPFAGDDIAIGEKRYRAHAHLWLGLRDLDLGEAYEWAAEEYRALLAEQRVEAARIDASASVPEVRVMLDADPRHAIDGVENFRGWAQALVDEAMAALAGDEFDIPPPCGPVGSAWRTTAPGRCPSTWRRPRT